MIRNIPRPILLPGPTPNASINPNAIAAMMTTRAMPDGTTNVSRKFVTIRPRRIREYVVPTRCITINAIRRARPDFVAMLPNNAAPKRNQGVSLAKPVNAMSNGTILSAQ